MEIITKSEARLAGKTRYFNGHKCSKGHLEERRVSDGKCLACERDRDKQRNPLRSRIEPTRIGNARNGTAVFNAGRAVPKCYDRKACEAFYAARPDGMEVDHIVPLNGDLVSGLHVHWNLQYLTPEENIRKRNTFVIGQ